MKGQPQPIPVTVTRHANLHHAQDVLADIYQENCNLAVWQRKLSGALRLSITNLLTQSECINLTQEIAVDQAFTSLWDSFDNKPERRALAEDIALLAQMFGCLFDTEHVGMRLRTLTSPMCPRFHIDRVPCRLVTTYRGIGSQWLAHQSVDHTKLGPGAQGKPDAESGLYKHERDIHTLNEGDVALLKGSTWPDNELGGIVHRSPNVHDGERRLMLSFDYL